MNEIREALAACFISVFPTLMAETVGSATPKTVDGWDSVATVTLLSVIEEEFQIEIGPEDLESLLSFQSALDYVARRVSTS
jgi:acyl carrier protein